MLLWEVKVPKLELDNIYICCKDTTFFHTLFPNL